MEDDAEFAEVPDFSDDSEEDEADEEKHQKMLSSITSLPGAAKKKKSHRTEASSHVSEYNLMTTEKNKVDVGDLLKTLQGSQRHRELRKKLNVMRQEVKTLEPALTKPQTERAQRSAAFKTASTEISKWQSTVKRNRETAHLEFPIQEYVPPVPSTRGLSASFKPRTELEMAVFSVLEKSGGRNEFQRNGLTPAEEEAFRQMDLEEAKARRAELQKNRALASYYEQKCRRNSKIKSRKYRRFHRQSKQKGPSLEELATTDPEKAKEEHEKAERLRAEERMTLKHSRQSKWAKGLLARRHKDSNSRQLLADNMRKGRELLTKRVEQAESDEDVVEEVVESDDEDDEEIVNEAPETASKKSTACINALILSSTKTKSSTKMENVFEEEDDEEDEEEERQNDENGAGSDKGNESMVFTEPVWDIGKKKEKVKRAEKTMKKSSQVPLAFPEEETRTQADILKLKIDSSKVLAVEKDFSEDNGEDASNGQRMAIAEAFASDDVVAEFATAKAEDMKEAGPKVVDLTLPGWGSWAGEGVRPPRRPRPRIIKHTGSKGPRADRNLPHVIISNKTNKKLQAHQVKSLPHPFTSWKQWERTIGVPIGREWNTENSFRANIRPAVSTKMGTIIEPMRATKDTKKAKPNKEKKRKEGKTPTTDVIPL